MESARLKKDEYERYKIFVNDKTRVRLWQLLAEMYMLLPIKYVLKDGTITRAISDSDQIKFDEFKGQIKEYEQSLADRLGLTLPPDTPA